MNLSSLFIRFVRSFERDLSKYIKTAAFPKQSQLINRKLYISNLLNFKLLKCHFSQTDRIKKNQKQKVRMGLRKTLNLVQTQICDVQFFNLTYSVVNLQCSEGLWTSRTRNYSFVEFHYKVIAKHGNLRSSAL